MCCYQTLSGCIAAWGQRRTSLADLFRSLLIEKIFSLVFQAIISPSSDDATCSPEARVMPNAKYAGRRMLILWLPG